MSQSLLLISLGPVQDFIATARRTRDLWFGSYLLSELSKTVAKNIAETEGESLESLIFPAPVDMNDLKLGQSQGLNVANKIFALISGDPADIANKCKDALFKHLASIQAEAYTNLRGDNINTKNADAQIQDLTEFYWVSVPLGSDYSTARQRAEFLLSAVKATRNYIQPSWASNAPKSSMDGQRESVIAEEEYDTYRETPTKLFKKYGVRRGERLCGVGLLKRHGSRGNDSRFFSTSHMATLPHLAHLEHQAKANPALEEYN